MSLEHTDKIEWVDINKIRLNPKNTNKHPDDQIERLAKIINYQGWRSPLVVASKIGNKQVDILAAGEGRYLAAKKLGLSKVPVNYQEFTDQDQFTAYVTSDNSIAAWADLDFTAINESIGDFDPSFDIDLLGIKDFEVQAEDKYQDKDADDVPDVDENEYGVELGDIYQLGEHRLMCGDSTCEDTVSKLMDGHNADMVFTDPPYGVSIKGKYTGEIKNDDLRDDDLFNFLNLNNSAIKNFYNGPCYICYEVLNSAHFYKSYGRPDEVICWNKDSASFYSDNKWNRKFELILYYENGVKPIVKGGTNVWDFPKSSSFNNRDENGKRFTEKGNSCVSHPTTKPVGLSSKAIEHSSKINQIILDCFLGSGSTLIACEKTNRKCYGMELDPHYCSVIIKRWEDFTGLKHEKVK